MKKIVVVLISLVVAILVIVGNGFAQNEISNIPEPSLGPEWKLVGINSNDGTTFYINTKNITYLPGGIVKVWEADVPRGETRRGIVNFFKKYFLSKGENPNNAERFWYFIELDKFNCTKHQVAKLEFIVYSFQTSILYYDSTQHEKWYYIPPGTAVKTIENYVCKKYK